MNIERAKKFIDESLKALREASFVRLTLSGYTGSEVLLKKIKIRPVLIKNQLHLSCIYSYTTKDITKNIPEMQAEEYLLKELREGFGAATLFTTQNDLLYPSLKKIKPTYSVTSDYRHDRTKSRRINPASPYLYDLKISDAEGKILKSSQDKYRQIEKFIDIIDSMAPALKRHSPLKIADMGAGKGYLTFSLYDFLFTQYDVEITGIEYRKDLVDLCNKISEKNEFKNLRFVQSAISDFSLDNYTMLIALHACDTATDDALAKAVLAGCEAIIVAPCCHKQVRREMEKSVPEPISDITRHGILLEREAEIVTDSIRALILEYFGYAVKVFEFVSGEHTAKNIMITAHKTSSPVPDDRILTRIKKLKKLFGIETHYLEKVLKI